MVRLIIFISLFVLYIIYSFFVYTKGTESTQALSSTEQEKVSAGKKIYLQYNCQSCHQVYGLGGYLGPDLTTAYFDKNRGPAFVKALLQSGGKRMPNFHFTETQIEALTAYIKYVGETATADRQNKRKTEAGLSD